MSMNVNLLVPRALLVRFEHTLLMILEMKCSLLLLNVTWFNYLEANKAAVIAVFLTMQCYYCFLHAPSQKYLKVMW